MMGSEARGVADPSAREDAVERAMSALADALVPPGGRFPGATEVGAGPRAVELLERMPSALRRAVTAQLLLLEHLPRLFGSGRLSTLPRERREEVLSRVRRLPHPLVDAIQLLEVLPLLAYGAAPQVRAALF